MPKQGPIPPLDPRLKAPAVRETTVTAGVKLPPPPAEQPAPGLPTAPLTAEDAARVALRLQPNIGVAKAQISVQQGLTRQAGAALSPQLTTLAGYTHLQSISGTSANATGNPTVTTLVGGRTSLASGFALEATLSQLVFDFNHTVDLVRQSSALEKAAAQNLSVVQSDTVLQVKQAFYVLQQDLRQVNVYELEVANRQAQLDLARSRYNVGLGLPSDVVTAETAKSETIVSLSQAKGAAELARINLAILIGVDPRTPLVPSQAEEPPNASNDVNALTLAALKLRPEVLRAQQNVRSAQYGVSAARSANSPAFSVGASVVSSGDEIFPQQNDLTLGLSIAWTPIDGGLNRGLVESARGNLDIAQKQLVSAQLTAKSDVAQAYVNLNTAEQQISAINAAIVNAELGVRMATVRYSTGIGTFQDIITAQDFLLTARTNLVANQSAIDQYRAALSHAIGAPLPKPVTH